MKEDTCEKHLSEETKRKISLAMAGEKNPMFGRHHSEESKKKMSEAKIGDKNPMFGRRGENNSNYGKHLSEETKRKMSEASKGNQRSLGYKHSKETNARRVLSRKIGKENYAKIKDDLVWDGGRLLNVGDEK